MELKASEDMVIIARKKLEALEKEVKELKEFRESKVEGRLVRTELYFNSGYEIKYTGENKVIKELTSTLDTASKSRADLLMRYGPLYRFYLNIKEDLPRFLLKLFKIELPDVK
jgi:hypothetical protein